MPRIVPTTTEGVKLINNYNKDVGKEGVIKHEGQLYEVLEVINKEAGSYRVRVMDEDEPVESPSGITGKLLKKDPAKDTPEEGGDAEEQEGEEQEGDIEVEEKTVQQNGLPFDVPDPVTAKQFEEIAEKKGYDVEYAQTTKEGKISQASIVEKPSRTKKLKGGTVKKYTVPQESSGATQVSTTEKKGVAGKVTEPVKSVLFGSKRRGTGVTGAAKSRLEKHIRTPRWEKKKWSQKQGGMVDPSPGFQTTQVGGTGFSQGQLDAGEGSAFREEASRLGSGERSGILAGGTGTSRPLLGRGGGTGSGLLGNGQTRRDRGAETDLLGNRQAQQRQPRSRQTTRQTQTRGETQQPVQEKRQPKQPQINNSLLEATGRDASDVIERVRSTPRYEKPTVWVKNEDEEWEERDKYDLARVWVRNDQGDWVKKWPWNAENREVREELTEEMEKAEQEVATETLEKLSSGEEVLTPEEQREEALEEMEETREETREDLRSQARKQDAARRKATLSRRGGDHIIGRSSGKDLLGGMMSKNNPNPNEEEGKSLGGLGGAGRGATSKKALLGSIGRDSGGVDRERRSDGERNSQELGIGFGSISLFEGGEKGGGADRDRGKELLGVDKKKGSEGGGMGLSLDVFGEKSGSDGQGLLGVKRNSSRKGEWF